MIERVLFRFKGHSVSVMLYWEVSVTWVLLPTVVVGHNECFVIGLNFLCGCAGLVVEKKGEEQIQK